MKSISVDFCEFYSSSCELCLKQSENPLFSTKCVWRHDSCKTKSTAEKEEFNQCEIPQTTTLSTRISTKTTSTTTTTTTKTSTIDVHENTKYLSSSTDFNRLELLNISSLLIRDYDFNKTDVHFDKKRDKEENNLAYYLLVSIMLSAIALIIGILIGFLLKYKYSKIILKHVERRLSCKKDSEKSLKNNTNYISKYQPNIYSGFNDIDNVHLDKQTKYNDQDSDNTFEHDNERSKEDLSVDYSDKSLNNNDHQKDNNTFSKTLSRNESCCKDYFTVQKNYDILPKKNLTLKNKASVDKRSSSTSSSADSNYGALNSINSQSCLFGANNYKLGKIITNQEVSRSNYGVVPCVHKLILNTDRPPLERKNPDHNCIVVNDDEAEEEFRFKKQLNQVKRFSCASSGSSFTASSSRHLESAASTVSNSSASSSLSNKSGTYKKHHHVRKHNSVLNTDSTQFKEKYEFLKYKTEIDSFKSTIDSSQNHDDELLNSKILKDILFMTNSYV